MNKHTWTWIGIAIIIIGGGLLYRHFAQDVDSRGATRLMRAFEENDAAKTRQLLDNGTDINVRDKSGQTALFYAAHYTNDPILLNKLVAAGADTFATDKNGYTPLMTAAKYNTSAEIITALARYGRFLEGQEENKNRALAVAAQYNNAAIIKTLLITGASPKEAAENTPNTADLLAGNAQLSEREKNDLRHILLVLEILEAREQFKKNNAQVKAATAQKSVKPAKEPTEKPAPAKESSATPQAETARSTEPAAPAKEVALPSEPEPVK